MLKKFIVERDIPGVDRMNAAQIRNAAASSNSALASLAPKVQWDRSYVTKDKTFCVYLAENEAAILEHSRLSGFPADKITEVVTVMDPTTASEAGETGGMAHA